MGKTIYGYKMEKLAAKAHARGMDAREYENYLYSKQRANRSKKKQAQRLASSTV